MKPEATKPTPTATPSSRPQRAEVAACVPLVSAQRGKFTILPEVSIEALAAAQLNAYRAFVKEIEGEEPEAGAVLSAGLEMLFAADAGFVRWQREQRPTARARGRGPA